MPHQSKSDVPDQAARPLRRRNRAKRSHIELALEHGEKLRAELAKLEEEVMIKRRQLEKFERFKESLDQSS